MSAERGRHAQPGPLWQQSMAAAAAFGGALTVWAAWGTGHLAKATWGRMGPAGHLVTLMVACWPAAEVAQNLGLIGTGWLPRIAASIVANLAIGAGWWSSQVRGRKAWREGSGRAVAGARQADENTARIAELENQVAAMCEAMNRYAEARGMPRVIGCEDRPPLRLVAR